MRLIDADAFVEANKDIIDNNIDTNRYEVTLRELINEAPTVKINTNDIEYKAYCRGLDDGMIMGTYSARPHGTWVQCSDRLPTAEDGERVIVHPCFEKPVCEYVFVPWKTVGFEYQVGHIDAWFAIPKYKETEGESE